MKIFKTLFVLTVFSILAYSCSSDDDNNGGSEQLANEQNQLEEIPVPLDNLNSDISIEGAAKKSGTPGQPNSTMNLEIDSNKAEAFQSTGFNLKFSSTETNIAGAYLVFKDTDNNNASGYFDIPVSSFNTGKSDDTKTEKSLKKNLFSKNSTALVDGEYEIDVDFGSAFPPGKFCADLCIYDAQENISQIVTVCIEVEAWGGNASIVGEWMEEVIIEKRTISCDNNESIQVNYDKQIIDEETIIVFESNGDFYATYKDEYQSLDYLKSKESCAAVYEDEIEKADEKATGKWAYNETNKTLTIVQFKFEDFITPEESENFPNGDLAFDSDNVKVEITNGKLVLTETYDGGSEFDVVTYVRR
ncbi:hypothetical protein [Flavivirga eckloniae]|uniref:Lipocalin-like domain-containing protein n=1 Tax=Flavivirga eckloniae TaxID=1803846 RepID=A0A2K9PVD4_9FLAO|nr:hypothetical protein [Flavivirga eckloniae]AUP81021.1 hypothetical protein C1H87_20810 [Flavivirga eckloniae]